MRYVRKLTSFQIRYQNIIIHKLFKTGPDFLNNMQALLRHDLEILFRGENFEKACYKSHTKYILPLTTLEIYENCKEIYCIIDI